MAKDSRPRAPENSAKGEGVRVPFKVQHTELRAGVTSATGQASFEDIVAPERRFVADSFEMRLHANGYVQWLFGQTQIDGRSLRALLDLRYPAVGMKTIAAMFKAYAFEAEPSGDIDSLARNFVEEPAQTLALEVNLTRLSGSRNSTVIDFFHSSGMGMTQALSEGHIYVLPVVRVQMPFDLLHLISRQVVAAFGSEEDEAAT